MADIGLARKVPGTLEVEPGDSPVAIIDSWRVTLVADEGLNDSDKTITVTASQEWQILWIWVEFTSTGTAGARQIVLELQDSSNDVIGRIIPGITQAASLTREYLFGSALADLTAERDTTWLMTPLMPTLVLQGGDIIRIYDNNTVDAAADDLIIQMQYAWRAV